MTQRDDKTQWPQLDFEPTESDVKLLEERLEAYNSQQSAGASESPICIVARNEGGEIVGGIKGLMVMKWLYVSTLWVAEANRGSGLGSNLLSEAERIAIEHGCIGACLTSFGFQAPEFYKRRGYQCVGQIDDYPPGDALYFLSRRFDEH